MQRHLCGSSDSIVREDTPLGLVSGLSWKCLDAIRVDATQKYGAADSTYLIASPRYQMLAHYCDLMAYLHQSKTEAPLSYTASICLAICALVDGKWGKG
ncbi:hypothetical protein NXC12_CH03024 [Rhizobium etli]|uniref:Uncharacterized protein n=1 Tax=Rhizobium etli TaxID=29449 RepID=A0AAN1BH85_RHIET|nr:hypothetical protein NXC12_CH03024 [Rhizobium etli]